MNETEARTNTSATKTANPSVWRRALRSLFGAAVRLHHYRDAHDVLLRQTIVDDERRIREQHCCYE